MSNKGNKAAVTITIGNELNIANSLKLSEALALAVGADAEGAATMGKVDSAFKVLAIRATHDLGFAFGIKTAPGYDADKTKALMDEISGAFKAAGASDDYQRKICQRVRDYSCEYILLAGDGKVPGVPKAIAGLSAAMDDDEHEALVTKANRTPGGQARVKAAKAAKEAAEKKQPPLSKEAKAAKAIADNTETALAYIEKAKAAIAKLPISNVTVASQHNLLETEKLLAPVPTEG